ncbi:MAG: DUF2142 domain-containing protein [Eubacteriales bacterium]|nr:DUF2142 domain-containing protein [Eubacteriales bacterium]
MDYKNLQGRSKAPVIMKFIAVFILALFCACGAVLLDNAELLKINKEERAVFALEVKEENSGKYTISHKLPQENKTADLLKLPAYIERLKLNISNTSGRPAKLKLELLYEDGEAGSLSETIEELQPIYVAEAVFRIQKENIKEIKIELLDKESNLPSEQLKLGDVLIDNTLCKNKYMAAFGFLLGLTIGALALFGSFFVKRLEYAFLLLILTVGGFMSFSMPLNKIGFDEEAHIQAVADMAAFPDGELHISDAILYQMMITEYNNPEAQPDTHEENILFNYHLSKYGDYENGERNPDFVTLANRMPAYFSMAGMMKLCEGLGLGWDMVLLFTRFANLLMYALLMFFSIALLPQGKVLMFIIALLPENIFLASTFSYDPFVTGAICLGLSVCLRAVDRSMAMGKYISGNYLYFLLAAVFIFLGCLPKAVYAPLILLMLMVLENAFKSNRDRHVYSLLVVVLFVMLIASFILPTVVAPSETGDARGGATSEVSQVGYILANPFAYAWLLIKQMISWIPQCFFGADCTTFMGHLVNGDTAFKGYYQPVLVMLLISFFVNDIKRPADLKQGIFTVIIGGFSCALVWTSMYVAFTEPGAAEIAGVQGRYFIPFMFPLYFLVSSFCTFLMKMFNNRILHKSTGLTCLETIRPVWYYIMTLLTAVVLWMTIYKVVIYGFLR